LVGIFITTLGSHLPNDVLNASYVHHALVMALAAIGKLGKSKVGDKTMIDTLDPFVNAYGERATSATISQAWLQALPAAEAGMKATADMVSKRGRSSLLKARSLGHLDPGAVSIYYVLRAVSGVLTIRCP
jgi:dihydroxyacetone kinase